MFVTLNQAPSGCDLWMGPGGAIKFAERDWMQFVSDITINRNVDKTGTRGRRKTKPNHCKISLMNPGGIFDDLEYAGRKFTVVLGMRNFGIVSVGSFVIEELIFDDPDHGEPTVTIDGKGHDLLLAEDWRPLSWRKKTPTDIVRQVAAERGWRVRVTEIQERGDYAKPNTQDMDSFLEDLAFDLGYEYWVEDMDDLPTLCFIAPEEHALLTVGWRDGSSITPRVTVGHGEGSPAVLRASRLKTGIRYPSSEVGGNKRTTTGAKKSFLPTAGADGGLVVDIIAGGPEKLSTVSQNTPDGQEGKRAARVSDAASTKRTVEVEFPVPLPWFRCNHLIPVDGHGGRDGVYRIIDIELKPLGGPTKWKGIIGGGGLSRKRQKPNANVAAPSASGAGPFKIPVVGTPTAAPATRG